MTGVVIITKDRQPRSFRWGISTGINQPPALPLSRAESLPSRAKRAAERVFGPLVWVDGTEAGAAYEYIVEVAHFAVYRPGF